MPLKGQRILVVEDNFLIALDIESVIYGHGGKVAAKAATLNAAMKHAEIPGLTAAILDSRLGADDVSPIAEKLAGLGIPFIFYTGRTFAEIAEAWPNTPVVLKPASPAALVRGLESCLNTGADPILDRGNSSDGYDQAAGGDGADGQAGRWANP
jgi:hypothetical protein